MSMMSLIVCQLLVAEETKRLLLKPAWQRTEEDVASVSSLRFDMVLKGYDTRNDNSNCIKH